MISLKIMILPLTSLFLEHAHQRLTLEVFQTKEPVTP